ncbi:NAD-dependent protein deacetylase sirtuin-7 [Clonorchis sinensis]|uniref:Regulatory protein SIR2 homolog 7 n=3 Tax=Clonorchis sinensis TaxID=79923 RepID=A0A8T1MMJ1_CLOSI|nr:NAD-dependent protein deacetylase sirtuin-7 [Clonorchis sinensis]
MEDELLSKATILANFIRAHKGRIVIYTGAGISTSTNIPDYRGTNGLWVRDKAQVSSALQPCTHTMDSMLHMKRKPAIASEPSPASDLGSSGKSPNSPRVPARLRLPEATTATPTFTHMAIKALVEHGYVRHVVSQNVDGLHVRSGLPRDKLSELHGNLFLEQCIACNSVIMRNFDVAETTGRGRHITGRICPKCRAARPDECLLTSHTLCAAVEKHLRSKRNLSSPAAIMLAQKHVATKLSKTVGMSRSEEADTFHEAPLLRDVIVHFYERQPEAGLAEIYRVSAAIEAVHGRSQLRSCIASCLNHSHVDPKLDNPISKSLLNSPWFRQMVPAFKLSNLPDNSCDPTLDSPATLIIVLGSSLCVLRNYHFLWPQGLGRCLSKCVPNVTNHLSSDVDRCRLAIVNLQPTCKDGLADLVIRSSCDQILQLIMHDCLGIQVPKYRAFVDDPLYRDAIPLLSEEEHTRTRPNIPFHLHS